MPLSKTPGHLFIPPVVSTGALHTQHSPKVCLLGDLARWSDPPSGGGHSVCSSPSDSLFRSVFFSEALNLPHLSFPPPALWSVAPPCSALGVNGSMGHGLGRSTMVSTLPWSSLAGGAR